MNVKKTFLHFCSLIMLSTLWFHQVEAQKMLPSDPSIKEAQLKNGFKYYIKKHTGEKNKVSLWLVVKAGSFMESEDQRGFANFLRLNAFSGTKNFTEDDIQTFMLKSNLKLDPDLNSVTSFKYTSYKFLVPTNSPSLLQNAINVLKDLSEGARLNEEGLEIIKNMLSNQWKEIDSSIKERINYELYPLRSGYSSYSARYPSGTRNTIQNANAAALKEFRQNWYRPDCQALIVVGDINMEEIESEIIRQFSPLLNEPGKPALKMPPSVSHSQKDLLTIIDDKIIQTNINFIVKVPSLGQNTKEDWRRQIVRSLFNDLLLQRIALLKNSDAGVFKNAQIAITRSEFGFDSGVFSVIPDSTSFEQSVKSLYNMLKEIKKNGFSQEEIKKSKEKMLAQNHQAYLARDRYFTKFFADQLISRFINGSPVITVELINDLHLEMVKDISPAELQSLVTPFLEEKKFYYVIAPERFRDMLPDEKKLNKWIR